MLRIATWNVNSIRVREPHVSDFLRRQEPDVLCLQETKVVDEDFPTDEFQRLGYAVAMAGQRSYNGVAIVSRLPFTDVRVGLVDDPPDAERRLIAVTVRGVRVYSAYVPNGKEVGAPSFRAKLAWLDRLGATLDAAGELPAVIGGDFNIARDERDVHDPVAYRGQLHFHPDEHAALERLLARGFQDAFRLHEPAGGHYSWWDYRGASLARNQGLRIDYLFLATSLVARCRAARMHPEERRRDRPSDHVPVVVDLD